MDAFHGIRLRHGRSVSLGDYRRCAVCLADRGVYAIDTLKLRAAPLDAVLPECRREIRRRIRIHLRIAARKIRDLLARRARTVLLCEDLRLAGVRVLREDMAAVDFVCAEIRSLRRDGILLGGELQIPRCIPRLDAAAGEGCRGAALDIRERGTVLCCSQFCRAERLAQTQNAAVGAARLAVRERQRILRERPRDGTRRRCRLRQCAIGAIYLCSAAMCAKHLVLRDGEADIARRAPRRGVAAVALLVRDGSSGEVQRVANGDGGCRTRRAGSRTICACVGIAAVELPQERSRICRDCIPLCPCGRRCIHGSGIGIRTVDRLPRSSCGEGDGVLRRRRCDGGALADRLCFSAVDLVRRRQRAAKGGDAVFVCGSRRTTKVCLDIGVAADEILCCAGGVL